MPESRKDPKSAFPVVLFIVVLAFFFISGACGLLYQVVWTRKLVLLFGTTSYAVSTVLSIFFLGLGVGSAWSGRLADRTARPLRCYAIFECIVGLWALFFLGAVTYGEGAVVALLKAFQFSHGMGVGLRALLALLLLFVPVTLMGATLPLLARFVSREAQVRGMRVGALYTLNTLGAVVGCFTAGFFFISHFGYSRTTLIGAVANVLVGMIAWFVSSRRETETATATRVEEAHTAREPLALAQRIILGAFFISGFCSLGLEVLWTRLLAIIFLGTTYAYTTMLTTLLLGIALGSAVASMLVDRVRVPALFLGIALLATGVGCVHMLSVLAGLPAQVLDLQLHRGSDWGAVVQGKFWLSFKALFIPTFFLGMTFPLVVKAMSGSRERVGRDVGTLYFTNTIGGVLGSLAGGFVAIPLLGTHHGILAFSLLLVAAGVVVLLGTSAGAGRIRMVALLAGGALLAWSLYQAPEDVNRDLNAGYIPKDHRVLHYDEGIEGTVAVSEPENDSSGTNRVLWINRVQATTSIEKGVKMNRLQGVLPLLFDRDPKDVLFMCFGSGITCGTLALSDFEKIDAVDISPEVLAAAPYFEVDNLGVIQRPEVTFHVDDGRNYMLTSKDNYDVITFEPMPLAVSGVSTFYTAEYYALCLSHLKPGGMVSQWVPLHSLNPEVVRSLIKTFTSVFPHYTAWFINADVFLIGSNTPLKLDAARIQARLANPKLEKALHDVGFMDVESILGCYLMDEAGLATFAESGTVMHDDLPWAEFVAPKLVYERTQHQSMAELEKYMSSPVPIFVEGADPDFLARVERRHLAHVSDMKAVQAYYSGMAVGNEALDQFLASLAIDPNDWNAKFYLGEIAKTQAEVFLGWEENDKALEMLDKVLVHMPENQELVALRDAHRKAKAEKIAKP